ncbi:MAG: DegT/DnrJ/EryC1/StrS family aminotransferase [Candidatus Omnitrophica bacterium]|nr:DegT/DnrJ/EryC1/StrS family aminotransferase [Candidatus Omnitrophota bacterium]
MTHLAMRGGAPVRTKPFPKWPVYDERDKQALIRELENQEWGIGSPSIDAFERKFAQFCGANHAVACTNGTDAIYIAMQALGVGAGDEVIIPPYTFIATAIGVLTAGAIPVFADIDPLTYNIDPESIREKITPRTKAIIPVHIAGNPADMDGIMQIAREHNLHVMEDAAQAHGAEWRGRRVGAIGRCGTFSFQTSKNLSSGEGGAIVTDDEECSERLRTFTNCGRVKGGLWYEHHELGGNHRLGGFQAALLCVGLERIEEQMKKREENARRLTGLLNEIPGVSLTGSYENATRHAYHLGVLRYNPEAFQGLPKKRFVEALQKEGVDCADGYLPLYRYHFFRHFQEKMSAYHELYAGKADYDSVQCPVCERVCENESVWIFQNMLLGEKSDMDDVAEAIRKIQNYADEAF